jgi:hypothetical protein
MGAPRARRFRLAGFLSMNNRRTTPERNISTMTTRQSAHRARRVANGARQKSFLLSPEVVEKLERLSVVYGSETKAVEALILGAGE